MPKVYMGSVILIVRYVRFGHHFTHIHTYNQNNSSSVCSEETCEVVMKLEDSGNAWL